VRFLVIIFLVFSCSSIKIGGENNANQSYETGYGEQPKSSSTTSVQTIEGDKINLGSSSNVNDALRGQASGLNIRRPNTGMPDDFATFVIRNFSQPPLIIVDGMEATIEEVDPNDIESISILKDAAAAIYGSRAGNGVVVVKTKRGK
tara:strand:+ start:5850 stop:6290 length:441 start_codon:yes stop_codon:yes gene_type:complete